MSPGSSSYPGAPDRRRHVREEQVRLLYANVGPAVGVTIFVAAVLAYLQWTVTPHAIILGWLAYMMLVCAARLALKQLYRRASRGDTHRDGAAPLGRWGAAFSIGAGFAGAGWGAASILLYPEGHLRHQVFLAFVLGGMMLGAVSLLSSRPEAFLAFILPIGSPVALRLMLDTDRLHVGMGLLAAVFTVNILITTWHIYNTVCVSLHLRFENAELIGSLQTAKAETDALNRELESRVRDRTSELHRANEQLRAEMEQRQQAEDELLRARKLESLGMMAGGIAHDFNNFLTIVQGNIALARLDLGSGSPVDDILDQIDGASQRAASLASQLLTFAKGGAPVRRVVSAARLLEEAVSLARAGSNVSINLSIADGLRAVNVDASQIGNALHNILLNARQAMPEGGLIEVRAESVVVPPDSRFLNPGTYVRISIRDYGCGIPPEVLPRIFDPYFTTKATGTGLGLAAAYAIVAKHQGHLSVESKVGEGTTFSIHLPASEEAPSAQPESAGKPIPGSGRVLVMDDEEALRRFSKRILEQLGYQVECARDGAEAIALFEAAKSSGQDFDAVLLDLTVPGGMGGKDAAAKLREISRSVPLIVSSGYSEDPVLSQFREYSFDAVLMKPWSAAELSAVLKQLIQASRPEPGG